MLILLCIRLIGDVEEDELIFGIFEEEGFIEILVVIFELVFVMC